MNNALHRIRRYIVVEITGTHEDAKGVIKRLEALAAPVPVGVGGGPKNPPMKGSANASR